MMNAGSCGREGWSRGAGANLLGANAGMGLVSTTTAMHCAVFLTCRCVYKMHTGSAVVTQGRTLAYAWEPASAHDEALLIATVPRLARAEPNHVDGASDVPWGGLSTADVLHTPAWRVVEIAPGSRANHSLTANGFSCEFAWEAEPGGAGPELQVLVASNGSFFGGGLPCRLCEMFRLPRSAPGGWDGSAPLSEWRPWWLTQAPLYRPHAATALSDLGGNITFRALSVTGGFRRGDIVLPIFAASEGGPGGASLELLHAGRGVRLVRPEPVTQLQLLCEFQPSAA